MATLHEPARDLPICHECDLCVVGGSCTGVFAAVRAAQLGATVCIIELGNQFGGNTTLGQVAVWHSLWDVQGARQVIGGLTEEVVRRLRPRHAVVERERTDPNWQFALNPAETACELDALVLEHRIRPFLHARVVAAPTIDGVIQAVVIEDKNGRRAIRARAFVDASGDADLVHLAGGATDVQDHLQPPTTAALFAGLHALRRAEPNFNLAATAFDQCSPNALRQGFLWSFAPPAAGADLELVFGTRVHGANCADADQLTRAEMEGRRQARTIADLVRARYPQHPLALVALPARIGVRETRHARCRHRLTEQELLHGTRFDDAIANGCYRVDIHHQDGDGLTFRYLDGREVVLGADRVRSAGRQRPAQAEDPGFYQVPWRSLLPQHLSNVAVAGRCLDADQGAFGAVRVQVNCNQLGEAAGVGAALALRDGRAVAEIDPLALRRSLTELGAIVI